MIGKQDGVKLCDLINWPFILENGLGLSVLNDWLCLFHLSMASQSIKSHSRYVWLGGEGRVWGLSYIKLSMYDHALSHL